MIRRLRPLLALAVPHARRNRFSPLAAVARAVSAESAIDGIPVLTKVGG